MKVKSAKEIIELAIAKGAKLTDDGLEIPNEKGFSDCFMSEMFDFCGKEPSEIYSWKKEWLDKKKKKLDKTK